MSHKSKKHSHHDKKPEKSLLKSIETPVEKRLRRFAKKERKEQRMKLLDDEYMGYTNADNPFGDTNLLKSFVWDKKMEKEGLKKKLTKEELEEINRSKLEQNKLELAKVKLRRMEREKEREARENAMIKMQREKEAAQFSEWEKQEDTFHLKQAKLRSKIRIEEGRAKPIDLLARYISAEEEIYNGESKEVDGSVEMHEPYVYLNGLKQSDLEDLQEDIKIYITMDENHLDYWTDLQIIVEAKIRDSSDERRESINASVSSEIVDIFKGKTPKQLQAMYREIKKKTTKCEEGVDITYWEALLSRLNAYMARARLRERHQQNLTKKLFQLKEEQGVHNQSTPLFPCVSKDQSLPSEASTSAATSAPPESAAVASTSNEVDSPEPSKSQSLEVPVSLPEKKAKPAKPVQETYDSGRYSPVLMKFNANLILTDPKEDAARLEYLQQCMTKKEEREKGHDMRALTSEEQVFERAARKGMDAEEAIFSVEHNVSQSYKWADKYRPRKPRYFNRVHTGFEWNKYNQTHYDLENPPPKLVQGYKFNIFYPDLIDKTNTPQYTIHPCEDNKDFAILKFIAGPPYETIAFKIVNRELEYSYKRGFRCQFQNNIFQLYFHFKRYRYRR